MIAERSTSPANICDSTRAEALARAQALAQSGQLMRLPMVEWLRLTDRQREALLIVHKETEVMPGSKNPVDQAIDLLIDDVYAVEDAKGAPAALLVLKSVRDRVIARKDADPNAERIDGAVTKLRSALGDDQIAQMLEALAALPSADLAAWARQLAPAAGAGGSLRDNESAPVGKAVRRSAIDEAIAELAGRR